MQLKQTNLLEYSMKFIENGYNDINQLQNDERGFG